MIPKLHVKNALSTKGVMFSSNLLWILVDCFVSFFIIFLKDFAILFLFCAASAFSMFLFLFLLLLVSWSINRMGIFFLAFLVRKFVPEEVNSVISNSLFCELNKFWRGFSTFRFSYRSLSPSWFICPYTLASTSLDLSVAATLSSLILFIFLPA